MKQNKTIDLRQKFHDRIIGKIVDWVLGQKVDEGNVTSLKWNKEDKELINTLIDNPRAAGIAATVSDPKFKRFFKSVAQNGLNTADVQMFYRHRDRLPLKKMNWANDLDDFEYDGDTLVSKSTIRAGFYMLEFQSDPEAFQSAMPLTLEVAYAEGGEKVLFTFNAISHRITKRLIWLKDDAYLSFTSPNIEALEEVSHLRLSRGTRSFFISRMMKKLGLRFHLGKHGNLNEQTLQEYWETYDLLFAPDVDARVAYQVQQRVQEPKTIPSSKKQVFDLSRWLR